MPEQKHTPAPWVVGWNDGITGPTCPKFSGPTIMDDYPFTPIAKDAECVAICPDQELFGAATGEENARRIVAAINACEGIPTEALEAGAVSGLLESLKFMRSVMLANGVVEQSEKLAMDKADAAIAHATGDSA